MWSATFLVAVQIDPLTIVLALAGVSSVLHAWRGYLAAAHDQSSVKTT